MIPPIDSASTERHWQERMSTDGMHESIIFFHVFHYFVRSHCYWCQRPDENSKTYALFNWTKLTFYFQLLRSSKYFATSYNMFHSTLATHIPWPNNIDSTKRSRIFSLMNFDRLWWIFPKKHFHGSNSYSTKTVIEFRNIDDFFFGSHWIDFFTPRYYCKGVNFM